MSETPSPPTAAAESLLAPLIGRLEQAQELICRSDALEHFAIVAKLCNEAGHLAIAGALLTVSNPSS